MSKPSPEAQGQKVKISETKAKTSNRRASFAPGASQGCQLGSTLREAAAPCASLGCWPREGLCVLNSAQRDEQAPGCLAGQPNQSVSWRWGGFPPSCPVFLSLPSPPLLNAMEVEMARNVPMSALPPIATSAALPSSPAGGLHSSDTMAHTKSQTAVANSMHACVPFFVHSKNRHLICMIHWVPEHERGLKQQVMEQYSLAQ